MFSSTLGYWAAVFGDTNLLGPERFSLAVLRSEYILSFFFLGLLLPANTQPGVMLPDGCPLPACSVLFPIHCCPLCPECFGPAYKDLRVLFLGCIIRVQNPDFCLRAGSLRQTVWHRFGAAEDVSWLNGDGGWGGWGECLHL